jgi:peptide/nickel transport system permease protein
MGITLFVVSILSFLIVALAPGDPFDKEIDPTSTPADKERQRDATGYDEPVFVKYTNFYGAFFHDLNLFVFGGGAESDTGNEEEWQLVSRTRKEPVFTTMWRKMLVTLPLVLLTTLITWTLSFPVGIYSSLRRGSKQDQFLTVTAYAMIAIPGFWIALLVINFVTTTMNLPVIAPSTQGAHLSGIHAFMDGTWHAGVPAVIGSMVGVAVLSRYVKGQFLEVVSQDYIRTAKAKGLDKNTTYYKHALRNASLPFITMLAGLLPSLFGGSVVFEAIYAWPGLGRWVFEAVFTKDIPVVVTSLFVGSTLTLIGILISDILYSVADPRVKLG